MNVHLKHFKDKDEALAWAIKYVLADVAEDIYINHMRHRECDLLEDQFHDLQQIQQIIWVDQDETL